MNIETQSYESLLPFPVVEALNSTNWSSNSMSVRMMDRGWAWLVIGRKLLIWKFREDKKTAVRTRRMLSPCFELQLPQSDLIHKADLINVFFIPRDPNTSQRIVNVPAALAISPEGTVRFWSNVTNERPSESIVSEVQGQEFCTLASLSPTEYLLGTTTGSIYQLNLDINAADLKNVVTCSSLAAPSGLISGISRRMTNLFFGPMSAEISPETRRPLIACPRPVSENESGIDRTFFVLASSLKLRQWTRTYEGLNGQNQLIREWDLQKNLQRKLATSLRIQDVKDLNFWPIDMITTKSKELLILVVTLDTSREKTINYATCIFNPYQAADKIGKTTILRSHSWHYSNESEEQLLALRFLERHANSPLCFMYDRKFLFLAQVDRDILDAVDYANQDDSILGAGFIDGHAILFTQRDGLICVAPVVSDRSRIDAGNETTMYHEASRLNETRLDQSSRLETSHQQSTRAEPMLVEINDDDDDNDVNQENQRARTSNMQRHRIDRDQSTTNRSNLDTSTLNRSVDQSSKRKADDVSEFMRENKEFEWVQQIDAKQFGLASQTLAKLAEESDIMKDRRDTLLALSKLAQLAE